MAHIDIQEAQAWCEKTKLNLGTALDGELEDSVASQVIVTIAQAYDTSSWTVNTSTPKVVRSIIAMLYVAWMYDRTYSEDNNVNSYSTRLRTSAQVLIDGIIAGNIELPDASIVSTTGTPLYYPTDTSSANLPTVEDPSLGPAKFTMGVIW